MESCTQLLSSEGPFAEILESFRPRPQQQELSENIASAIEDYSQLVVEAGTGVGKTFAYLVPAILSGRKVIISTGTRHLQDQLYFKDLPVVRKALAVPLKTTLLKGRANYLCLQRLQNAPHSSKSSNRIRHHELRKVQDWAHLTRSGDIAELSDIPEDSDLWPLVTSTVDNCLGIECPHYQDCHVVKARRAAQDADIVVVNHHLFFADLALKQDGFGEILPSANAFILDEAHTLPEIAGNFFGINLGSRQLLDLARDITAEQIEEAADMPELREKSDALVSSVRDLRLSLGTQQQRAPWPAMREQKNVSDALEHTADCLEQLANDLEEVSIRGKGLKQCHARVMDQLSRLQLMRKDAVNAVQWFETFKQSFVLHNTPLEIADIFTRYMQEYKCAWIFTSATLSVDGRFEHFTSRLGLSEASCVELDSPFDYTRNALLYLPKAMPQPNESHYTQRVIEAALPVIRASGGRTFLLFTSHRALREAQAQLQGSIDYPLLVQGTAPRNELIEQFRELGNAVLLGTSSFWEGVDVRGSALSCVIIDKLPFASPGDPVMQARLEFMRTKGLNPFMDFQIPQAVIALKQGIGRLIRDYDDTGVLMICDPRLKTKPYGRMFLKSLPDLPMTSDITEIEAFFNGGNHEAALG